MFIFCAKVALAGQFELIRVNRGSEREFKSRKWGDMLDCQCL